MVIIGPVALSENWVIGKDNDLPWNIPEDLKHFKEVTLGKTVVMGRKTYESIVKRLGKPLPGRKNVVLTTNRQFVAPPEVFVFHNAQDVLDVLPNEDVYVIGGEQIFKEFLPFAEKMDITHIQGEYEGDAFFPKVNFSKWHKVSEEQHQGYTFAEYVKP